MPFASQLRVLVVDDAEDCAECTALLLGLWGYGARVCYDGPAALDAARAYRPHVVLLDIEMPRMDGFEVARRLHQRPGPRHAVLVAITGHAGDACRSRAYEAGFAHYLIKPVDADDLHELLRGMEGRPHTQETTRAIPPRSPLAGTGEEVPWPRAGDP